MNLVYFYNYDLFNHTSLGVKKKIYGQLEAFKNKGFTTYLLGINKLNYYILDFFSNYKKENNYLNKEDLYQKLLEEIVYLDPKIIYIRHSPMNFIIMQFYGLLRENCKNSKIIIEFPTFPYDEELKLRKRGLDILYIDIFYRQYLKNYFDFSVNFNGLKNVFDIKSIPISNGISLKNIDVKKNIYHRENIITLISVASINKWHGYDRVLKGISEYYNKFFRYHKYLIKINIVGEGEYLPTLKELCHNLKIESYVSFWGTLDNKELDKIFDYSDIALGALGLYHIKLTKASPIKTKEYCARAIPFIIGYNDLSFDNNAEYIMKVENNDNPIDICKIIDFYKSIRNKSNLSYIMRNFAENNLTWEHCFDKLFKAIDV